MSGRRAAAGIATVTEPARPSIAFFANGRASARRGSSPAPGNRDKPVSRNLPDHWLRQAEVLAGLKPQEGSLWHAFRRMAGTEFKGLPEKDVMRLLGWTDPRSLKASYEHADTASTLAALHVKPTRGSGIRSSIPFLSRESGIFHRDCHA